MIKKLKFFFKRKNVETFGKIIISLKIIKFILPFYFLPVPPIIPMFITLQQLAITLLQLILLIIITTMIPIN